MGDGTFERRPTARTVWSLFCGAILAVAATPSAGAGLPVPMGAQFQVNTYTNDSQVLPAIAADAAGDFVVVWESSGSSGGDTSS